MSEYTTDRTQNGVLPHMQQLVFITKDGHRVSVCRAIATEASFVLRDLLDGQDWGSDPSGGAGDYAAAGDPNTTSHDTDSSEGEDGEEDDYPNDENSEQQSPGETEVDLLFADGRPVTAPAAGPSSSHKVDVLDSLFGPTPTASTSSVSPAPVTAASPSPDTNGGPRKRRGGQRAGGRRAPRDGPPPPSAEVELPFPYLPRAILSRVVKHMNYRYRISTFGIEAGGPVRVFATPMREIARPMTMPLAEYLDAQDRAFVDEWDDETTIWMVKAAMLLNYPDLQQLASAKLGSLMREKNVDSMRALLGLESTDFTPAEEAELKKEQQFDFPK